MNFYLNLSNNLFILRFLHIAHEKHHQYQSLFATILVDIYLDSIHHILLHHRTTPLHIHFHYHPMGLSKMNDHSIPILILISYYYKFHFGCFHIYHY